MISLRSTCISAIKSHEKQNHCSRARWRNLSERKRETVFWGNKLHYRRFCEADKTRYAENGNNWGNSSWGRRIGNACMATNAWSAILSIFFAIITQKWRFLGSQNVFNEKCQFESSIQLFSCIERLAIDSEFRETRQKLNSPVDLAESIKCRALCINSRVFSSFPLRKTEYSYPFNLILITLETNGEVWHVIPKLDHWPVLTIALWASPKKWTREPNEK